MKIGVLTFHRAINYGAVLQCYALCEYLKSLGHDVDVIDYRPKYIEKYRRTIPLYDIRHCKGLIKKFKQTIGLILSMCGRIDARKRFDLFLSQHFSLSKPFTSENGLPKGYDLIVFGSDQIWSPEICEGFDEVYWGRFPHNGTKLVTYAASMGGHNKLTDKDWQKAGLLIRNFDDVSVREEKLQFELQNKLGVKSKLVVDPTVLVDKFAFDTIVQKPKNCPDRYVLVFSLVPIDNLLEFSMNIAEQTDSKIVVLSAYKGLSTIKSTKQIVMVTPTVGEFLGWFKYAKCVVTVSFHGTVFSLLFNKDFYSIANHMQDRAEQLLKSVGLERRIVCADANLKFESVDYTGIEENMRKLRRDSRQWIDAVVQFS